MARILILEDDVAVQAMLRQTLEEAGHEVDVASDGVEAVRLHQEAPADLVVTDVFMPARDGLKVIEEFRHGFPQVRIIAISTTFGFGPSILQSARQLGAHRTLAKPVNPSRLLQTVQDLLH